MQCKSEGWAFIYKVVLKSPLNPKLSLKKATVSSPSPVGLGCASCLEVMYGLASSSGTQSARPVRKGRLLFRWIVQPASPCWWWHPGSVVGSRH